MRASSAKLHIAFAAFGALATLTAYAATSRADVKHEGTWPDADKPVTVDADHVSRQDAVRKLADAAGWSVVLPSSQGDAGAPIDVHVKGQAPGKVLDLILSDGSYVAKRDGTLIAIAPASAPAAAPAPASAPVPASAPASAAPTDDAAPAGAHADDAGSSHRGKHAHDRVFTGGHSTIEAGSSVADVTVLGGELDVYGEIEGDLAIIGGNVEVHEGAHVHGDVATMGGKLAIDDGAIVDGDVGGIGGNVEQAPKAQVGGTVHDGKGNGTFKVDVDVDDDHGDDDDDDDAHMAHPADGSVKAHVSHAFSHLVGHFTSSLTADAFLFVFGAIFLALFPDRMSSLKAETAARPMRSFALGVLGAIALPVVIVLLCVTVIGIPAALVLLLLGAVAVYAGITSVLTTAGHAVLGHKTQNAYVHLAAGCAMLLVLGLVPWIGAVAKIALIAVSIGILVATRVAGLVPLRKKNGTSDPYRTAPGP
jgi:hypothetical protein